MSHHVKLFAMCLLMGGASACSDQDRSSPPESPAEPVQCGGDNGGLSLPPGFCATVFADQIGHARHLAIAADGTLFANTWSGWYFGDVPAPPGGFVVAMRDNDNDGRADEMRRVGIASQAGGTGGTGIALYGGGLYAEEGKRILRYALGQDGWVAPSAPEVVLDGLPVDGDHNMHPFLIDPEGALYVNLGSATNACQAKNRMPGSKGLTPCEETKLRAGIWRYEAKLRNQRFGAAGRFATGLRNVGGMAIDPQGRLFGVQHGRDQLAQNWRGLFSDAQNAELPAEELVRIEQGKDYGWPECYFDPNRRSLVLAPEYGGDGRNAGVCAQRQGPIAAFPAHWAPNDIVLYSGSQFPRAYQGGLFVAFHGSWNRPAGRQAGYNVVFQPFREGAPTKPFVVFADGFAGAEKAPGKATYRPAGLAVSADGALYIADDQKGRIWKVTYRGPRDAPLSGAPAVRAAAMASAETGLATSTAKMMLPPGVTPAAVRRGEAIFAGHVLRGTCAGCHGAAGVGAPTGSALRGPKWLWSDGSLAGLRKTIRAGVERPKHHPGAMPPAGGLDLAPSDLDAVAAYVWFIGHREQ